MVSASIKSHVKCKVQLIIKYIHVFCKTTFIHIYVCYTEAYFYDWAFFFIENRGIHWLVRSVKYCCPDKLSSCKPLGIYSLSIKFGLQPIDTHKITDNAKKLLFWLYVNGFKN